MIKNERKLNVDIAGSISEFEDVMKEFRLRKDIYKILFRGKGLEFESYRDFNPDDDASDIDWKASSRTQKLLVKQYKEERDLKIIFVVDIGSNMVFGSTEKLKAEYITELVAAFAKIILDNNDRIGFILFSDKIKHFIGPRMGERHFQFFIDLLSRADTYGGVSNIDLALDFAAMYLDKSINSVIIVSDFLKVSRETEKKLSSISQRFETIIARVRDPLDFTMPDIEGEITLENPMTHEQVIVNPKVAKRAYEAYAREQSKLVEEIFKKSGADYVDLITNVKFTVPLAMFLKERVERRL
jgi:uncharacterized protein (DUF58 family)